MRSAVNLLCPPNDFIHDTRKWILHRDRKLNYVFSNVKDFKIALDCGAWAGWWTNALAKVFDHVYAFEPVPLNADYARTNNPYPNVTIFDLAIADKPGTVYLEMSGAHYGQRIKEAAPDCITAQSVTIDSMGLSPDFIKLDLEGMDLEGLIGAEQTIVECRPILCVETKNYHRKEIHKWLAKRGYIEGYKEGPDTIFISEK